MEYGSKYRAIIYVLIGRIVNLTNEEHLNM